VIVRSLCLGQCFIPQPATKLAVDILSIAGSVDALRVSEMTTKIMREGSSSPSVLADDLHAGPKLSGLARWTAWFQCSSPLQRIVE
jgi:hypothetical protein